MSPSSVMLFSVCKNGTSRKQGTSWYRQDYTQHKVVVPGASVPGEGCTRRWVSTEGRLSASTLTACWPHSPQR
ncbi:MAG: hypothetical protein ACLT78_05120 [Escherichia coli]